VNSLCFSNDFNLFLFIFLFRRITIFLSLFPEWSLRLSVDPKALIKAGSDGFAGKSFQYGDDRRIWGAADHNMGLDTLCKICVYSIWLMPWSDLEVEMACRPGLEEFIDGLEELGLYDRNEHHRGGRVGYAAGFGHIHGGDNVPESLKKPEDAGRNANDLDRLESKYPTLFCDPNGDPAPFRMIIPDNAHGSGEKLTVFASGLSFFLLDLDILVIVSNAGKCSTCNPVEQLNGALATRLSGVPIPYDVHADPGSAAELALTTVVNTLHGATFRGGQVHVFEAKNVPTTFRYDTTDMKVFMASSEADKKVYISSLEEEWPGVSNLYRLVWSHQSGCAPHPMYSEGESIGIWLKNDSWSKPWRGPESMKMILAHFGGNFPAIVPSESRIGSYMDPAERLATWDRFAHIERDE
jgi:hypothetical protein